MERMRDLSQRERHTRAHQAVIMVLGLSSFETGKLRRPASVKRKE